MGVIKDDNQQQSNVEKKIHKPQEILKGRQRCLRLKHHTTIRFEPLLEVHLQVCLQSDVALIQNSPNFEEVKNQPQQLFVLLRK